jgi:glutathione S-transferase
MPTNPPLPLLYSYRRCPYAMRARMALLQAKRQFRVFEVSLRDKPAELLRLSPKGTVPVLRLPDGQVLEESWDVMRWAWEADDGDGWWSRAQTDENLALLRINDGEFKRLLDRYKYPERQVDESTTRDEVRSRAVQTLLVSLDNTLHRQSYLGGTSPCAADVAIFPFVRQFSAVQPDWFVQQPLPALHIWLRAWLKSDLFVVCMRKLPTPS